MSTPPQPDLNVAVFTPFQPATPEGRLNVAAGTPATTGAGRPTIGPRIELRIPVELLDLLDQATDPGSTRADTIRRILTETLNP